MLTDLEFHKQFGLELFGIYLKGTMDTLVNRHYRVSKIPHALFTYVRVL